MDSDQLQIFAGAISSMIFMFSNLPMVFKAIKTKDLNSYSLGHLGLSNLGNLIHWVYISSLPFGPIWFLHAFNTFVAALMLFCYFRFKLVEKSTRQSIQLKLNHLCLCFLEITSLSCTYINKTLFSKRMALFPENTSNSKLSGLDVLSLKKIK